MLVQFETESSRSYIFDLTNKSSEDIILQIKTVGGKDLKLRRGETVKAENESIDGVRIANNSSDVGVLTLAIYLQNQKVSMPHVVAIHK